MKHIIDRVLELQEDEIAAQNTPEPVEDLNLQDLLKSLQPKIRVFGCGGAGSNAVARLEAESLFDDEYVKEDGHWKFKKMALIPFFMVPLSEGWAGEDKIKMGVKK